METNVILARLAATLPHRAVTNCLPLPPCASLPWSRGACARAYVRAAQPHPHHNGRTCPCCWSLLQVESQSPGWVDKYLAGYVNLAGPLLGLPKALSPMLSGWAGMMCCGECVRGQRMGARGSGRRHDVGAQGGLDSRMLLSKLRLHQCMPRRLRAYMHACAPQCRQDSNARATRWWCALEASLTLCNVLCYGVLCALQARLVRRLT
jgi:hypothetical protein